MATKPYSFRGFVHQIGETVTFASGFAKRTVILCADTSAQYKDYAAFDFTTSSRAKTDHTKDPDGFQRGDEVVIEFYISANENRNKPGQWFSSNRAVKMERVGATAAGTSSAPAPAEPADDFADDAAPEDIPF